MVRNCPPPSGIMKNNIRICELEELQGLFIIIILLVIKLQSHFRCFYSTGITSASVAISFLASFI